MCLVQHPDSTFSNSPFGNLEVHLWKRLQDIKVWLPISKHIFSLNIVHHECQKRSNTANQMKLTKSDSQTEAKIELLHVQYRINTERTEPKLLRKLCNE